MSENVVPGTDVEVRGHGFDPSSLARLNEGAMEGFCSIQGTDQATRLQVLDALTNAEKFDEHLNEVIMWKDVVILPQTTTDDKTGEIVEFPSTTLIDADGVAYNAGSIGVYNSVKTFMNVLGHPSTWESPVPVKLVQQNVKNSVNRVFTLKLAQAPKGK